VTRASLRFLSPAAALIGASLASAQVTHFPVPTANSRPYSIIAGTGNDLWFTESNGNKVARITTAGVITEFPVPTAASGPYGIAIGRDGRVWFTERFGNQIARLDPATGQIDEFPIPTPFAQPWAIALSPSGNLWFTEEDAGLIGRIMPNGVIREFTPPSCCFPTDIAAGPDGRMWWTLEIGDQIGRIEPGGAMTMFTIPNVQVLPWDITAGLDGRMWFTELAGRAIGRISTAGAIQEIPVPGAFSGIAGVAPGPDGRLYFTENDTHQVGVMDATGTVVQTFSAAPNGRPLGIVMGPDGNLWFTEADANSIGRLSVSTPGVQHVLALDAGFSPRLRRARLGERVQWTFLGPNHRSVTDASGLGLFDSGVRSFVTTFSLPVLAAGVFVVRDTAGISPDGALNVPVELPPAGTVGVPFRVTWAIARGRPGLVFDVQVRTPGATGFANWTTGPALGADYTALAAGPHEFRARVRDGVTGQATLFSLPARVVVN
jgi:virginiamycin B lyase